VHFGQQRSLIGSEYSTHRNSRQRASKGVVWRGRRVWGVAARGSTLDGVCQSVPFIQLSRFVWSSDTTVCSTLSRIP